MHYNHEAAWTLINSTPYLVRLFYETPQAPDDTYNRQRTQAFFFTHILNSEYFYDLYLEKLEERAPPDHDPISREINDLITRHGWLKVRAAIVKCVDIASRDEEIRKKVRKLPGKI